jgi:hypothetical protein
MPMQDQFIPWIYIALAIFALIGLVELILALRALLLEQREGLLPSFTRAAIISLTTTLLLAIAFWAFVTSPIVNPGGNTQPNIATPTSPPADPQESSLRSQLETLDIQISDLQAQTEAKRQEAQDIQLRLGMSPQNPVGQVNNTILALILATLLVVAGTASLFLIGDRQNLLPEDWLPSIWRRSEKQAAARRAAIEKLDHLAKMIQDEQYEAGLQLAETIDRDKLSSLDAIDLLYLKSYCTIQLLLSDWLVVADAKKVSLSGKKREELTDQVIKDLGIVLDKAPRMAEAEYLLAIALARKQEYEAALERFERAETNLNSKELNFKHMKSFCMLHIAEALLRKANSEGADELFDKVVSIGVMADKVPGILVENRLINVVENFKRNELSQARKGLETVQQVKGLTEENKKSIEVITEAMEILFLFTEKRAAETLRSTEAFLKKWSPKELPEPDDQTADEYMFKMFEEQDLSISPEIYRAFYFLEAVVMIQLKAASGTQLSKEEAHKVARSLLRALQFDPREREALAALGALSFWFMPEKRSKALEWMEAARSMGVESDYLRRLLERHRDLEIERKNILDRFMTLSARYLADASVNTNIREALIEEMGLFQEFRPILLDLGDIGASEEKSPTLQSLLNRTKYLQELIVDLNRNQMEQPSDRFRSIQDRYISLVREIEVSRGQLERLEQQIMEEIGKQLLQ